MDSPLSSQQVAELADEPPTTIVDGSAGAVAAGETGSGSIPSKDDVPVIRKRFYNEDPLPVEMKFLSPDDKIALVPMSFPHLRTRICNCINRYVELKEGAYTQLGESIARGLMVFWEKMKESLFPIDYMRLQGDEIYERRNIAKNRLLGGDTERRKEGYFLECDISEEVVWRTYIGRQNADMQCIFLTVSNELDFDALHPR